MVVKWLEKFQLFIGVTCLSIFFIGILIQIIARYLGISTMWTEEASIYAFIWSIFMGASVMLNKRLHFNFNMFSESLSGKPKVILTIVNDLIIFTICFFFLYFGVIMVQTFWDYRWASVAHFKMGYVWLIIPIMGATMVLYKINHIVNNIKLLIRKEYE